MKFSEKLSIELNSISEKNNLEELFYVELHSKSFQAMRSKVNLISNGNNIVFEISAPDIASLKSAHNAIINIVEIYSKVDKIVKTNN